MKKEKESIFQSAPSPKSTIVIFIQAGIVFCCLFCATLFNYTSTLAAYAEEPYASSKSHSEKDLSFDKEQSEIIKRYLQEAKRCYEEGRYHEAVKFWDDILTINPNHQEAREGKSLAEKKIAKIKDFFGKDVFQEQEVSELSLKNCVEIAEESSLLFQIAREQINLAKIKVWEARRTFFPSLTFSWAETKGIRPDGKIKGVEYGVEGKQPAFRSGELMYTLAQSKVNLNIAEKNYDRIEVELYFEVAGAYYELVKAKQFLKYAKALYEESKPLYEMAQKKYEKGLVPEIEYLNAESKFNQIYYKSIFVESDYEIARLALEQKLNIERAGTIDVALNPLQKSIDEDLNTCLFRAIENKPDLKMSEFTVKSAEYGEKIAQAKGMPSVDLAGHYKKSSEVYKDEQSLDPQRKWYAGLEVSWPFLGSTGAYSLYKREDPSTLSTYSGASESKGETWKLGLLDNLKQFSEGKEAEIAHVRAEEELNEVRKKVIREVKDAFYGYEKSRIQLEAARVQREFSEKENKILTVKHSLGEINLSELFENLVRLMEANEAYFKAEKDLNTSIAALNKAIGIKDYF